MALWINASMQHLKLQCWTTDHPSEEVCYPVWLPPCTYCKKEVASMSKLSKENQLISAGWHPRESESLLTFYFWWTMISHKFFQKLNQDLKLIQKISFFYLLPSSHASCNLFWNRDLQLYSILLAKIKNSGFAENRASYFLESAAFGLPMTRKNL